MEANISSKHQPSKSHTSKESEIEELKEAPEQEIGSCNSSSDGRAQEEQYIIPDEYANLDELATPSPVGTGSARQQNCLEDRGLDTTKASISDGGAQKEHYVIPDEYANLDELAAPSPVDTRNARQQSYSEDRALNTTRALPNRQMVNLSSRHNGQRETTVASRSGASQASKLSLSDSHLHRESRDRPRILQGQEIVSKFMTKLYTISYLIFFSILGTLARLGLQSLTFYPGAPVQTGVLWANFGGSMIMGFLSEDQKLFLQGWGPPAPSAPRRRDDDGEAGPQNSHDQQLQCDDSLVSKTEHGATKKTIPLYIGLATGFCGSFTSFSSFIRDAFLALSNTLPVPISNPSSSASAAFSAGVHRNPGYSILATTAVVILTVGLSLGALQSGAHLALALEPYTPSIPFLFARKIVDRTVVFVAWGSWLGVVLLAIFPPDRPRTPIERSAWAQETWRGDALFALVFAPLGCLLRFYASVNLNSKLASFPLGTFVVNVFGTVMESVFFDLQHVPVGKQIACQVLQGAMDGFCGSLTTVSTWVAELKGLRTRHAYVYGIASVGVGLGLAVIIMGSVQWTVGFKNPLCQH